MLIWFVVLYLMLSIGIGLYVATRVHTAKEFAVAGRHLPLINLHLHHASRRQRLLQAGILMKFITERTAARGPHWVAPPTC